MEYQELTLEFHNLVWELVERKGSEEIRKDEVPSFVYWVVFFMRSQTEWVGTATELLEWMGEKDMTPNMVTKYLGQYACEVLEPEGITYTTKRTAKNRLIKLIKNDSNDADDGDYAI